MKQIMEIDNSPRDQKSPDIINTTKNGMIYRFKMISFVKLILL
jgi:hypothetical protein